MVHIYLHLSIRRQRQMCIRDRYWLKDQSPNLFDANYARKHAYKGVCDGIAGKDISEGFTGTDWEKVYE